MRTAVYLVFLVLGGLFSIGSFVAFLNREATGGSFIALLIGVIFLYYSTVLKKEGSSKQCPFCAEMIKKEAIKCRYCGAEQIPAFS